MNIPQRENNKAIKTRRTSCHLVERLVRKSVEVNTFSSDLSNLSVNGCAMKADVANLQ